MAEGYRHIELVERGMLRQKWYARFIADNGEVLAVTEHYHNFDDLMDMLEKYYPDWQINESEVSV